MVSADKIYDTLFFRIPRPDIFRPLGGQTFNQTIISKKIGKQIKPGPMAENTKKTATTTTKVVESVSVV